MNWRSLLLPFAQTYWRLRRPMTLGVRVIATNSDGHVLLVRHSYTPGWYLPGGGVEKGETAIEAASRELAEEAGLVAQGALRLLSVHANFAQFKSDHVLVFRAEGWVAGIAKADGEIAEMGWFDPRDLPDASTRATRARIGEFLGLAAPSVHW